MAEIRENPAAAPVPAPGTETIDITGAQAESRDWLEENQKLVIAIVGGLIAIAAAIFLYTTFIQAPAQKEASQQLWRAQQQFEKDSFQLALLNPAPGFLGFVDIAKEYGSTPAGNLANYYAGISYLQLGQYEAALDYLGDYDDDGEILPATKAGAIGDAHAQLGDLDKAEGYYEDAVSKSDDNEVLAPYYLQKLGMLRERQGKAAEANTLYTRIQQDFPLSVQAGDIEKYIMRTAG